MSATLNADLFSNYFGGAPMIHIPVSPNRSSLKLMYLVSNTVTESLFGTLPSCFFGWKISFWVKYCTSSARDLCVCALNSL